MTGRSPSGRAGGPADLSRDASQPKALIPNAGVEQIDVAEFHRRLKAQGVSSRRHWALVCPICRTVQSMASLVAAGATPEQAERQIGFSCEGRLTGAGPWSDKPKRRKVRGCDWSLGGLFRLHNLEVLTDDGAVNPRFEVAGAEQAKALAQAIEARSDATPKSGAAEGESAVPKGCAK